ncbi:acyl transferase domain-containing protein [Haloactinospora alba]|uniref:Acyl transferase domain-containing protein n=1 Tax=Haloactinospora alba TaxID=405555 RepID=A0A543NEM7_9ACTN|nr:type I polyketide synthase [Haloactinospora alba]TQN30293.1 acyl transferase domain-containing protein [Haloactinospora alba]
MTNEDSLELAIVGIACRYPGAPDVESYWNVISEGREALSRFTPEELTAAGTDPDRMRHPGFVPAGGVLPSGEYFDSGFFGYSARDAATMDPQQRIFLESAWHALEDAGHAPDAFDGAIGVYAGQSIGTHRDRDLGSFLGTADQLLLSADDKDFLSTRVAHKLGLTGPALTVQTACSTSLVAVHTAGQALLHHDCDMALAGGVSWSPLRRHGYLREAGDVWSADGRMRPFDADASGYVPADGLGIVVLRRLADALDDGDRVYAVVKGSAVNNDGSDKISFYAPSAAGQQQAVTTALATADTPPETIGYVESHGTATALGDLVEFSALSESYRTRQPHTGHRGLGSVKANIGHTDAAAGVAGVIKTALMLHHRFVPACPTFSTPHPDLDAGSSPFTLDLTAGPWQQGPHPRRAAVNSSGIGGTNAHLVLEEAPPRPEPTPGWPWQLVCLSARDQDALSRSQREFASACAKRPDTDLADIAATLSSGRASLPERACGVFRDTGQAARTSEHPSGSWWYRGESSLPAPEQTVVMFPGAGPQYRGMARDLYARTRVFGECVDECLAALPEGLRDSVREAVLADDTTVNGPLEEPTVAMPALFITEVATFRLLRSLDLAPTALLGHSFGEYAAAHVAGVFTLADALSVLVRRAELLATHAPGAMVSVAASPEKVQEFLDDDTSVAAVNGPELCVVSGVARAVDALADRLERYGTECRRLPVSLAAHSPLVDAALPEFRALLETVPLRRPDVPVVSNLSGRTVTDEIARPEYWVAHMREPVRFRDGLEHIFSWRSTALVEAGPGSTLADLARAQRTDPAHRVVATGRARGDSRTDDAVFLEAVGRLWSERAGITPSRLFEGQRRRRTPVLRYGFTPEYHPCRGGAGQSPASGPAPSPAGETSPTGLYGVSWGRVVAPRRATAVRADRFRWVLFSDGSSTARQVGDTLRKHGAAHTVVIGDGAFRWFSDERVGIDGASPEHHAAVLDRARESGLPLRVIDFRAAQDDPALRGLRGIAHGLGQDATADGLCVVTRGAHNVTGAERLSPHAAGAAAAARTLTAELGVVTRHVDLDPHPCGPASTEAACTAVLRAFDLPSREDPVVLRGGHRWQRRFLPVSAQADTEPAVRTGGVYVVTGGLGGVGAHLAEHLARGYGARLVLVSRSAEDDESSSARGHGTAWYHRLGTDVLVRRGDVCDADRMTAVLREAVQRLGRVDGVVHAAGTPSGGLVQFLGDADVHAGLRAKRDGAHAITSALLRAEVRPDFVVHFSSLAAFAGAPGLACYSAGNAYLDAYAAQLSRESGTRTLSVNWDRWRGVGMAEGMEQRHREVTGESLTGGMRPTDALRAFDAALADAAAEQVVASAEHPDRLVHPATDGSAPEEAEPPSRTAAPDTATPSPPESSSREGTEQCLLRVWEDVLGVSGIEVHDSFFDLGGHSLTALQVTRQCRDRFGIELTARTLFTEPTIAGLARVLSTGGTA